MIKRLLITLTTSLFFINSINTETLFNQKLEVAAIIGAALCLSRKGFEFDFNEIIHETIIESGYESNLLSDQNVLKLGNLIAQKLGSDCTEEKVNRIVKDEQFIKMLILLIN